MKNISKILLLWLMTAIAPINLFSASSSSEEVATGPAQALVSQVAEDEKQLAFLLQVLSTRERIFENVLGEQCATKNNKDDDAWDAKLLELLQRHDIGLKLMSSDFKDLLAQVDAHIAEQGFSFTDLQAFISLRSQLLQKMIKFAQSFNELTEVLEVLNNSNCAQEACCCAGILASKKAILDRPVIKIRNKYEASALVYFGTFIKQVEAMKMRYAPDILSTGAFGVSIKAIFDCSILRVRDFSNQINSISSSSQCACYQGVATKIKNILNVFADLEQAQNAISALAGESIVNILVGEGSVFLRTSYRDLYEKLFARYQAKSAAIPTTIFLMHKILDNSNCYPEESKLCELVFKKLLELEDIQQQSAVATKLSASDRYSRLRLEALKKSYGNRNNEYCDLVEASFHVLFPELYEFFYKLNLWHLSGGNFEIFDYKIQGKPYKMISNLSRVKAKIECFRDLFSKVVKQNRQEERVRRNLLKAQQKLVIPESVVVEPQVEPQAYIIPSLDDLSISLSPISGDGTFSSPETSGGSSPSFFDDSFGSSSDSSPTGISRQSSPSGRISRRMRWQDARALLSSFANYDNIVYKDSQHVVIRQQIIGQDGRCQNMMVVLYLNNRALSVMRGRDISVKNQKADKFHKLSPFVKDYIQYGVVPGIEGIHTEFARQLDFERLENRSVLVLEAKIVHSASYDHTQALRDKDRDFPGSHRGAYVFMFDRETLECKHACFHETLSSQQVNTPQRRPSSPAGLSTSSSSSSPYRD
ncbi:hypothetical protein K2X40_00440 [Candidatus Babeliales bacterium]|nr:hypothetical protein [Candidatus Babeliales bacterium]